MKNGKKPNRRQKIRIKASGLIPGNWLVVKDMPEYMEVISRIELKKIGAKRIHTRKLYKEFM